MRRRTLLASIVGVFLLPLTSGEFPGRDRPSGSGAGGLTEFVNTDVTSTGQAQPASTAQAATKQCPDPVKLIGLSRDGPYLPVAVDGRTYNLAIALDIEETFIFSSNYCGSSRCFPSQEADKGEFKAVEFTTGAYQYDFECMELSRTVVIGTSDKNIIFNDYELDIVDGMPDGMPNAPIVQQLIGRGVHGIIGLKNSSELIQQLSQECHQNPGFGIHLQANSFLAFGGLDVSGSNIGSYNSSSILQKQDSYDNALIGVNGTKANGPFNRKVIFDSTLPFNAIPDDIFTQWNGTVPPQAPVTITIGSVTFSAPWATLNSSQSSGDQSTIILGAPFFQYVYVASIPGYSDQALLYTPDDGTPRTQFESFEEIASGTGVKTGADATSAPKPSSSSNNNANNGSPTAQKSPNSTNVGAIVGGVIGGVIFLILIAAGACFFLRRRRQQKPYQSRGMVKEYGGPEFDPVVGSPESGIFPHFNKEAGYASLPKPPPAPAPQITPIGIGPVYESQTEYTPTLHPYHDESPARSLSATPSQSQVPTISLPPQRSPPDSRRVSATPSLTLEPPSPLSRNVSAASRRGYPSISQMRDGTMPHTMPEEDDDDYDMVSMASGPTYDPIHTSAPAASSAPRLPFARNDNDRSQGL
ncbi:hypothetical protein ABW21_db0206925 [Orbilia brochopaga]|nr:hypothetical protein ABW21_db0206925 [Drechslerella brochopaga]